MLMTQQRCQRFACPVDAERAPQSSSRGRRQQAHQHISTQCGELQSATNQGGCVPELFSWLSEYLGEATEGEKIYSGPVLWGRGALHCSREGMVAGAAHSCGRVCMRLHTGGRQ